MDILGKLQELIELVFKKDTYTITIKPKIGQYEANVVHTLPDTDADDPLVGEETPATIKNKKLEDTTTQFINTTDITKQLDVELDGAATGTTTTMVVSQTVDRSITLPDADDTLVGKDTADVLTNKSIDADANVITNIGDSEIEAGLNLITDAEQASYISAVTHITEDGKSHSDVVLNNAHRASDGKDHSDVVLNNAHRISDGKDHSDVVLNNAHRISDGKDHEDVVLNNTHRTSDSDVHGIGVDSDVLGTETIQTITNKTIDDELRLQEIDTPANPSAGYLKVYPKIDDKLYIKNSAGIEKVVGGGLITEFKSASFTAELGKHYVVDATSGVITVTLPDAEDEGVIRFSDVGVTWSLTNYVRLTPASGDSVDGNAADEVMDLDVVDAWIQIMGNTSSGNWTMDEPLLGSDVGSASTTAAGLIDTEAQSFAGEKTFTDGIKTDTIEEVTTGNGVQIQGRTDGTAIEAGNIGEVKDSGTTWGLTGLTTTPATLATLTLPAGVWQIFMKSSFFFQESSAVATSNKQSCYSRLRINSASGTTVTTSTWTSMAINKGSYLGLNADVSEAIIVNISSETTYYWTIYKGENTTDLGSYISSSDDSYIYAIRKV